MIETAALTLSLIAIAITLYERKERKNDMHASIERIRAAVNELNANVETLKNNVATESAQHLVVVEKLKEIAAHPDLEKSILANELEALATELEASVANTKVAVDSVQAIVLDEPAETEPPANITEPNPGETAPAGTEG